PAAAADRDGIKCLRSRLHEADRRCLDYFPGRGCRRYLRGHPGRPAGGHENHPRSGWDLDPGRCTANPGPDAFHFCAARGGHSDEADVTETEECRPTNRPRRDHVRQSRTLLDIERTFYI